jgi:hypothetical protein
MQRHSQQISEPKQFFESTLSAAEKQSGLFPEEDTSEAGIQKRLAQLDAEWRQTRRDLLVRSLLNGRRYEPTKQNSLLMTALWVTINTFLGHVLFERLLNGTGWSIPWAIAGIVILPPLLTTYHKKKRTAYDAALALYQSRRAEIVRQRESRK